MIEFLQIGSVWLNVNHINRVEANTTANGMVVNVKVYMTGGPGHLFTDKDAQQLMEFVRQHKIQ